MKRIIQLFVVLSSIILPHFLSAHAHTIIAGSLRGMRAMVVTYTFTDGEEEKIFIRPHGRRTISDQRCLTKISARGKIFSWARGLCSDTEIEIYGNRDPNLIIK